MKKLLLCLSTLFLSVSFATAQTVTYEISPSTGTLTEGINTSYEWVSNQTDLTLRATNDGGEVKNISYISNGTILSLNAFNSKGQYYTTTYTISVPEDGGYKITGYNISATAYKTVIVNGIEYKNNNSVTVTKNNIDGYSVSFTVERKKNDNQSTSAAAIDISNFTVTVEKVSEGGEDSGDDTTPEDLYASIEKPSFGKAGNTTFVKAATLTGGVEAEVAGIQAVAGQACVTKAIPVEKGAQFDLNITYQLNWGDLAIYQIDNDGATKEYGYYYGKWEANGSTAKVAQYIAEDGISISEVVDGACTATFPISINENHNIGDIIVVRAITGVIDNATNSAYEQGISEGGYVDFLFVVTEPVAEVWSSFYATFPAVIPEGIEAYIVTAANSSYVTLTQIYDAIPANTGVILKGGNIEANINNYYSGEITADVTANLLKGSNNDSYITEEAYVLGNVDGEYGFYKALMTENKWLNNANKAYLPANAVPASLQNVAAFSFRFGDGTTAVENVEIANEKVEIYDLSGRKVENPAKGIYIVNGIKTVIK